MRKWIIYLLIIICLIVVIFDVYLIIELNANTKNPKLEQKKELASLQELNQIDYNIIETSYTNTKISPNAKLLFETVYFGCMHNIVEETYAKEDIVNKNELEISEIFHDWEIKKFASDNVIFYKKVDKMCGNDYLIKEDNGFISILKISEDGKEELYETTELETTYLPEIDLAELQNGIKVHGIEEVNKILENYE